MTVMERADYATAKDADVACLRRAFDDGHQYTKDSALSGFGIPERRFRAAVSALRHEGYPVISESGQGSTYRRARTYAELEHFIATELNPRANDLMAQARQLRDHAREHFGAAQSRLFGEMEEIA